GVALGLDVLGRDAGHGVLLGDVGVCLQSRSHEGAKGGPVPTRGNRSGPTVRWTKPHQSTGRDVAARETDQTTAHDALREEQEALDAAHERRTTLMSELTRRL